VLKQLGKRLKKIEELYRLSNHVIEFDDGTKWEVSEREWESLWDLDNLKSNPLYLRMREEHDKGNYDIHGLIHVLNAYASVEEIWADEIKEGDSTDGDKPS
jgi:uncharacterized protein (UPF0216 family)